MKFSTSSLRNCVVLSVLLFGSYLCFAQSGSLFAGYKGLPWGSNLPDIQAHFSDMQELGMTEDDVLNIYMQKNPIDAVDNRLFYFWNDKLVRVRLFYDHEFITEIGADFFKQKLAESFGNPNNQRFRENVKLEDNKNWDIFQMSWEDVNTSISFESKQMRFPGQQWVYQLEFQSVKLFEQIKEGKEASEPERDWGW